jgi:hypothetical protein
VLEMGERAGVGAFQRAAYSTNTLAAYRVDWGRSSQWFTHWEMSVLPADPRVEAAYLGEAAKPGGGSWPCYRGHPPGQGGRTVATRRGAPRWRGFAGTGTRSSATRLRGSAATGPDARHPLLPTDLPGIRCSAQQTYAIPSPSPPFGTSVATPALVLTGKSSQTCRSVSLSGHWPVTRFHRSDRPSSPHRPHRPNRWLPISLASNKLSQYSATCRQPGRS